MAHTQKFLSVEEAAERLAVKPRFIYRLVETRRIRHYKVGKYLRFDVADVDAFIASSVVEVQR